MSVRAIIACQAGLGLLVLVSAARAQAPAAADAPPLRLTRAQAVREALAHNPAIAAAREQVAEATAGITIATAWPDPSFVNEDDQLSSFANPHSATEKDFGVQFTVPYPGRTRLNGKVARATRQQADYALLQLQEQTASQTAQAYDAVLKAIRHHDDLVESRTMSKQFVDRTQARFQAGTAARLDLLKAKVDYAKTENDLIANERSLVVARAGLNKLLGRPAASVLEFADQLSVPGPIPDLPALERLALESRPELRSMKIQERAARDSTTLAKQFWAPDLNFTLWKSYFTGAPNGYKFDGGFSLPLFFWNHEKGAIAQAKHKERELEATENDLVGQVMLDLQTSYAGADSAYRQAIFLRDELVPEAQAAYHAAFTSYNLGGSSALDLLDAKSTLLDAQSQYTDALGALNDATADLERAVGAPLPPVPPRAPHEP
jgi:outer membrane protein TolC